MRSNDEVADFLSFAPEKVDSYEIGYKGALLDRRLIVALAAFRADYGGVQIPGSQACTVAGLPSFCGVVTNAGSARFQGFEAEVTGRLGENLFSADDALTVRGSLGYIDAEFRRYIANIASVPTDVAPFRKVQNTPKWTASATAAYRTAVGEGSLDLSSTVSYRSRTTQFEIPNPFIDQKGYALFDANLVYNAPNDRWSIGLHGKNLTDKQYKTSGYVFVAGSPVTGVPTVRPNGTLIPSLGREGVLSAFYGSPRQVFVTGKVKF